MAWKWTSPLREVTQSQDGEEVRINRKVPEENRGQVLSRSDFSSKVHSRAEGKGEDKVRQLGA